MRISLTLLSFLLVFGACERVQKPAEETPDVATFLADYNAKYQELLAESSEAEWKANTYIMEGDTATENWVMASGKAMADFTGSKENIDAATEYLKQEDLTDLQIRQLNAILYSAGSNPATAGDIIEKKIKASNDQNNALFSFKFTINGDTVDANYIDSVLDKSDDLDMRLKTWEASKEVGVGLKDGLVNLQGLRNESVRALGYKDYFQYQVSDYGMEESKEMLDMCKTMVNDIWPLYRELHTWARYSLAEKYGTEVPEMLPAHWLPNRWGQDWTGLVEVEGLDVDKALSEKSAEWITKQGEEFYVSLGFERLPQSFYDKSSLYPAPDGVEWSKNNHASAWHMNNDQDVRSLMSIVPNTRWWGTALHELGHIYYFLEYSNDDVPIILRGGANRGYHEAMGSLLGLAAMQQPFLENRGLLEKGLELDQTKVLLKEALEFAVLLPWGAGVMTEFEYELYSNELSKDQLNAKWWELKQKYQGIAPPTERGEEFCDAASKTHINNDAAQYYDYAISNILLFQFHDHIAKKILKQDPHATDYWGSKETGEWLASIMRPGATVDWNQHLVDHLGNGMSATPMLEYFEPLMEWLKKENEGREHTLPESVS